MRVLALALAAVAAAVAVVDVVHLLPVTCVALVEAWEALHLMAAVEASVAATEVATAEELLPMAAAVAALEVGMVAATAIQVALLDPLPGGKRLPHSTRRFSLLSIFLSTTFFTESTSA